MSLNRAFHLPSGILEPEIDPKINDGPVVQLCRNAEIRRKNHLRIVGRHELHFGTPAKAPHQITESVPNWLHGNQKCMNRPGVWIHIDAVFGSII